MVKNLILFVDDEANILKSIRRAVIDEDFAALFANSAAEALKLMEIHEISVLVTDMMMPERDGLSLLKEVKIIHPMTIRIILSGDTELSRVLAAINQGDIFRFIPKPWSMESDLLLVIRQGIEYYNLRREKHELERSLHQRNAAYKKMLRTLEAKFHKTQCNVGYLKKFLLIIVNGLEHEFVNIDTSANSKGLLKLHLVREITNDYFQTIPVVLEEFALQDIAGYLTQYLIENDDHQRYHIKVDNADIKCFGNFKLLLMIILTIAKIVCRLGGNETFKHLITSQVYQDKSVVRISNVVEFGYVDGAKVLIDAEELLSHANLEFYTALLAQIGQTYGFDVAYTYVNQNTSLIAISAEFSLA